MHRITSRSNLRLKLFPLLLTARVKPIRAKGIAKIVWLNLTKEK
jgi:hypothetical protein